MSPRGRRASRRAQRKAQRARDKAAGKRIGFFWRWRRVFFLLGLLFVLGIAGVGYLFTQVPLPAKDPPLLQTTFFCAADVTSGCNADNSLAQLSGGEDRVTVTYDQIPPVLVDAVLSAEDRTYFEHGGVDPVGVARALWADLRSSGSQQGGSTITQQYVKNVYLTDERTVTRKVKEAVLAVKLERELPKTEILNRYLNTIYFGRGAYGVQAASKTYFGKNVGDLSLADAAYMAGLIRAPEVADANRAETDPGVRSNLETAIRRRTSVLDAMLLGNYITQEQHDAAEKDDFADVLPRKKVENFGTIAHTDLGTQYFVNYVDQWLTSSGNFTPAEVRGGGLRVYTTLDYGMQADAVDAVQSTLGRDTDPESALIALDTQGHIRAMYGGSDYGALQVNLATGDGGSGRPAGSTFKAFAVAEALTQGIGLETTYNSPAQVTIPKGDAGKDWKPRNDDDAAYGQVNMVKATASSINTYFAQLVMDIDPDNLASLATRMGVESRLTPVPSLVLGTERGVAPRHGRRLLDLHERGREGRSRGRHPGHRLERSRALRLLRQAVPGPRQERHRPGQLGPQRRHRQRHRHRCRVRAAGGRQDRHHPGSSRCVVRRLHLLDHRGGVERVRRQPPDGQRAGQGRVRRHLRGTDLGQVHGEGQPGSRELSVRSARRCLRTGGRHHERHHADRPIGVDHDHRSQGIDHDDLVAGLDDEHHRQAGDHHHDRRADEHHDDQGSGRSTLIRLRSAGGLLDLVV